MTTRTGNWPVVLRYGSVTLRPLRPGDAKVWSAVRTENYDWLTPWEATAPQAEPPPPPFRRFVRQLRREARHGQTLPFAIEVDGAFAGQLTVSAITYGSLRSASIGYWVARRVAGRGVAPTAVALVVDHCFDVLQLNRIEINIRPENAASLRVVEKLGFREEGLRVKYLHVAGAWRDHRSFALVRGEVPEGVLARYLAAGR